MRPPRFLIPYEFYTKKDDFYPKLWYAYAKGQSPPPRSDKFPLGKGADRSMKFTFTDKKVTLPKKVHDYAEKKIGKLERYFQTEPEAAAVFSVEKGRNNVEVTIRSGGTILRTAESTSDMFASIDAAVADIERQLRRHKTRLEKRLRKDAFVRSAEEDVSFVPADAEEDEEESFTPVRTKRFPIKPMTVEEAILQMELVGHTFFAFRNEDAGGAFSVVYKRNNGGYGLIEDDT